MKPRFGVLEIRVSFVCRFTNRRAHVSSIRSDLYRHIVGLLTQARKDAGLTQVELADRIGQRQTFISKVELGERRIDVAEFVEIARAIGIDPYKLLRRAEKRRT